MKRKLAWKVTALAFALWAHAASGQSFSSGSTGADGIFSPASSQNITVRPGGVYNYTTINIPVGVTIRYFKNADNAPVVILATGDVTIAGSIVVSGSDGIFNNTTTPSLGGAGGPAASDGGTSGTFGVVAAAGKGPGGGAATTGSAPGQGGTYGASSSVVALTPLVGGSGGGGGALNINGSSGGGGGGAVLIASSTKITINGPIRANGGNFVTTFSSNCSTYGGPGSGGAIRLVAPEIAGGGANSIVQAVGGLHNSGCVGAVPAGTGRIRMEATVRSAFTGFTDPVPSIVDAPGPVSPAGNPALANVPTLTIASVGGVAAPATQTASYSAPDIALAAGTANPVPVVINATNTPVGAPTEIRVRLIPRGTATSVLVPAVDHTGSFASSTATANVNLTAGQVTVLQAHAAMTLTGQLASLFPLIDGEPVEQVAVAATLGERSAVSLVTKSGKEVRLDQLSLEDQLRVAQAWEVMRATRIE